ncbi:WD40-repeat-containing domain protein, partial [Bipolaris maydis]
TSSQTLAGHSDRINSVAFSYDSKFLGSASCEKTVKVWKASSGKCWHTLKGHRNCVNDVLF